MELLTTSEESHREGGWRDRQRQVAKGFTVTAMHGGTAQHEGSRGRTAQSQRPAWAIPWGFCLKTNKKQGWECSLLVECLFSRLKTLGSILSPENRSWRKKRIKNLGFICRQRFWLVVRSVRSGWENIIQQLEKRETVGRHEYSEDDLGDVLVIWMSDGVNLNSSEQWKVLRVNLLGLLSGKCLRWGVGGWDQ